MNKFFKSFSFICLIVAVLTAVTVFDAYAANTNNTSTASNFVALDMFFINIIRDIREPLVKYIGIMSFLIGIVVETCALIRITKPGFVNGGKGTPTGTLAMLIVGAMLISLPATINIIENSLFGGGNTLGLTEQSWKKSDLSYTSSQTNQDPTRVLLAINATFQYIKILGLIAFIRGLYLLKTAVDGGQASMLAAFTHIFGGVFAMNIAPFLRIFFSSALGT